jgi:hypothetical protein
MQRASADSHALSSLSPTRRVKNLAHKNKIHTSHKTEYNQRKMTPMNIPLAVTVTSNASVLLDVVASSTASNDHDYDDDSSSIASNSSNFYFLAEEDDESVSLFLDLSCNVDSESSTTSPVPQSPQGRQQRRHTLPVLLLRHDNKLECDTLIPSMELEENAKNDENNDDDEEDSVLVLLRARASNTTNPNRKSWSDQALDQMDDDDMVIEMPLKDDDDHDDDHDYDDCDTVKDAELVGGYKSHHRNTEEGKHNSCRSSKGSRQSQPPEHHSYQYHPSRE